MNKRPLDIGGVGAIPAAAGNQIALAGCGANASRPATEGGGATFGLALVILEQEEIVGTDLHFGAQQGLIRRNITPVALPIVGALHYIIVRSNGFVVLADCRTAHHVVGKALRRGIVGHAGQHEKIGEKQEP